MPALPETLEQWQSYLDAEIEAVCAERGWGRQVRRKWTVREKPVAESPIDDYEWKLIPSVEGLQAPREGRDCDEGSYYVFGVDTARRVFRVQHDTFHVGDISLARCLSTFTEVPFDVLCWSGGPPLRDYVSAIVSQREPNVFSLT